MVLNYWLSDFRWTCTSYQALIYYFRNELISLQLLWSWHDLWKCGSSESFYSCFDGFKFVQLRRAGRADAGYDFWSLGARGRLAAYTAWSCRERGTVTKPENGTCSAVVLFVTSLASQRQKQSSYFIPQGFMGASTVEALLLLEPGRNEVCELFFCWLMTKVYQFKPLVYLRCGSSSSLLQYKDTSASGLNKVWTICTSQLLRNETKVSLKGGSVERACTFFLIMLT